MTQSARLQVIQGSNGQSPSTEYEPTYENRLRIIGRHIDRGDYRSSILMEVPGGFLLRARSPETGEEQLFEFPDDRFEPIYREMTSNGRTGFTDELRLRSVIAPTGYQDLFRALGARLDETFARSILMVEGRETIFVRGQCMETSSQRTMYADFEEMLEIADIDAILEESIP